MTTHHVNSLDNLKGLPIAYVQSPDMLKIIDHAAPGKDGLSLLYSLAGGLSFRIARLASIVTTTMAAHIKNDEFNGIDMLNEAFSSLDEAEARKHAFYAVGLKHKDMVDDLRQLLGFYRTVTDKIASLSKKEFTPNWIETITRAAEPREVAEWKLVDGWNEYVEACHGKPEMDEAEHREMEKIELAGKPQAWGTYASQIIDTIESLGADEVDFEDLSVQMQKALLMSSSTDEKEATLRKNAKKLANSPSELHTKRAFISSFILDARKALTHGRYAELANAE